MVKGFCCSCSMRGAIVNIFLFLFALVVYGVPPPRTVSGESNSELFTNMFGRQASCEGAGLFAASGVEAQSDCASILLLTIATPNLEYAKYTTKTVELYAKQHSYTYVLEDTLDEDVGKRAHPSWHKLAALRRHLQDGHYDAALWSVLSDYNSIMVDLSSSRVRSLR